MSFMLKYLYLLNKIINVLLEAFSFYRFFGFNLPLYIKLIIKG